MAFRWIHCIDIKRSFKLRCLQKPKIFNYQNNVFKNWNCLWQFFKRIKNQYVSHIYTVPNADHKVRSNISLQLICTITTILPPIIHSIEIFSNAMIAMNCRQWLGFAENTHDTRLSLITSAYAYWSPRVSVRSSGPLTGCHISKIQVRIMVELAIKFVLFWILLEDGINNNKNRKNNYFKIHEIDLTKYAVCLLTIIRCFVGYASIYYLSISPQARFSSLRPVQTEHVPPLCTPMVAGMCHVSSNSILSITLRNFLDSHFDASLVIQSIYCCIQSTTNI